MSKMIDADMSAVDDAIRSPEFYDRLAQSELFASVTSNGHEVELIAPSKLPKLILKLFPKAPDSVGWTETVDHDGQQFVIETIPDVPDHWREHFSISRTLSVSPAGSQTEVVETIVLDLELPKKWNRLVGVFEKRLTELLEVRLQLITDMATS